MTGFFRGAINTGAVAGLIWGWLCMGINQITGAFPFEGTFAHNIVTFGAAGAIFGIVAGGLVVAIGPAIPIRSVFVKSVLISTALWVTLWLGGVGLVAINPGRYNLEPGSPVSGIALAVLLGAVLGLFGRKGLKEA